MSENEAPEEIWLNPYDTECVALQDDAGEGWFRYVFAGIHYDTCYELRERIAELEATVVYYRDGLAGSYDGLDDYLAARTW